jgi:hypothetical protein
MAWGATDGSPEAFFNPRVCCTFNVMTFQQLNRLRYQRGSTGPSIHLAGCNQSECSDLPEITHQHMLEQLESTVT